MHICSVPCSWSVVCILKQNWETADQMLKKKTEDIIIEGKVKQAWQEEF